MLNKDNFEILEEPCPCDNCDFENGCRYLKLACEGFAKYLSTHGRHVKQEGIPTRMIYNRVFDVHGRGKK